MANFNPRAQDLAYVRFSAPDLGLMAKFLHDFGMQTSTQQNDAGQSALYGRGTDPIPFLHETVEGAAAFLGLGFQMQSRDDLEAVATMAGASPIEEIPGPGGGDRVRFTDPQGYEIDAVVGRERAAEMPTHKRREPLNTGDSRARFREPVRLKRNASHVKRLGHCVIYVADFRESEAWYKERFGLICSDEIKDDSKDRVIGAFMRCNCGDQPVDHHTLFPVESDQRGMQHAAFEVTDWDDLMLGHDHLAGKGYEHRWGIGKHELGSQVFDYWHDPFGNNLEHFTDGDLFDAEQPTETHGTEALRTVQWGPGV
ncbi:MAG: VOC family protein [Pseudomonadota bacterium]